MVSKDQRIMFVFPGQGAQYAGIGSDLYAGFPVVRKVYAEAADTLGYDIAKLSFEGPEEELHRRLVSLLELVQLLQPE